MARVWARRFQVPGLLFKWNTTEISKEQGNFLQSKAIIQNSEQQAGKVGSGPHKWGYSNYSKAQLFEAFFYEAQEEEEFDF